MELSRFEMKKLCNLLRIAAEWHWKGWELLSKKFSQREVMTIILEMASLEQAWLMLHLMAKSSTSMLVTNAAWCTVFVSGQLAMWTCEIDVWNRHSNIIFDASISYDKSCKRWQRVVENHVIEFLCAGFVIFFSLSFLVTKLKEKRSGKISMMQEPGENSWLRGEKDGKMP